MKTHKLIFWTLLLFCLIAPNSLLASTYKIKSGIELSFTAPPAPWQVSKEPPAFLVDQRAAALHPPQLAAARKAGLDTPEAAARKMLLSNDLFLFNPQTKSHIEVDFSPLKQGESPASARALRTSARYTAEELYAEKGLDKVKADSVKTHIEGAATAYRVEARFRKHDQPVKFIGIITFALKNWVYLYYTGAEDALEDHAIVNRWLKSIKISSPQK